MPGQDEEHKAGAGKQGHEGEHGKACHEHVLPVPRPKGVAGATNTPTHKLSHKGHKGGRGEGPGGRGGRGGGKGCGRGGKRGHKGKRRPGDHDDTSDEDSEEEGDDGDDDAEGHCPGVRRAGRVAGKAWKKKHGVEGRTKDMSDEQKKEIRAVKRQAREAFKAAKKG